MLPVVPLREQVMFPGIVMILDVGGPAWKALAEEIGAARVKRLLLVTDPSGTLEGGRAGKLLDDGVRLRKLNDGGAGAEGRLGVEAEVIRISPAGEDFRVILRGVERRRIRAVLQLFPYLTAEVDAVDERPGAGRDFDDLVVAVRDRAKDFIHLDPDAPKEATEVVDGIDSPGALADRVAAHLDLTVAERIAIQAELDVTARLRRVLAGLDQRIHELSDAAAKDQIDPALREEILREKMRKIQDELGEAGEGPALDDLDQRVRAAGMPPEVDAVARKELRRLRGMQSASPDFSVGRTYVEWLADLPWSKRTEDKIDLAAAREVFDADHHGLEKVKKRMLEYLAVRRLRPNKKGPILLLVGPPGVGKTSLGRSIARALGRKFVRVSLGGVSDESEIRGHRRTYVGALPGRIIHALKQAGTRNPVFLLDEVDKLSSDVRGDPAAALLEVLDPEQNGTFSDHYLEVPFDLSEVIFVATANDLTPVSAPLRDRTEILHIAGYTPDEKRVIAQRHLVPRQVTEHGLVAESLAFSDGAVDEIIASYTREAGVRNLEREIGAIVRAVAVKVAAGDAFRAEVTPAEVPEYLGPPRFFSDLAEESNPPGVVTGLAWTPAGGEILFVEATRMPGHGKLMLTGQLGDVMQESAQAALSFVRSHAADWGIAPEVFAQSDLHLHVPAGGVPKDGPSAGVALTTALVSLLADRPVRGDVAITGEVTLRGHVLPVGGISSKVLAAHRAGARRVVLPARNAKDLVDVPPAVREALDIVLVSRVGEALDAALLPAAVTTIVPTDPPLSPGGGLPPRPAPPLPPLVANDQSSPLPSRLIA
jgi:ATP-dependent Lon protease